VYRNSLFQTFWLSFVIWLHKKMGTWKMVDTYIVLTDFAKNIFINSSFGVLEKKFVVKPNFIAAAESNDDNREDYFLFIGRLSEEKGVDTLLESFNQSGLPLCIGGDGPLKEKITGNGKSSNITYLGTLDKAAVQKKMQQCTALIFPSIWYEGMPMTLIEALASGTPVIASDLGAMATMISNGYNGVHFKAGNAGSLTEKANYWNGLNRNDRQSFYTNARISYETYYTPAKNKQQLLKIYHSVL
jgi:glycosyltransferase involved in cell wall biosynthesis